MKDFIKYLVVALLGAFIVWVIFFVINVGAQNIPPTTKLPTTEKESGATAICQDGVYSYSNKLSGTCSRHGGVKERF